MVAISLFITLIQFLPLQLGRLFPNQINTIVAKIIDYRISMVEMKQYSELLAGPVITELPTPVVGVDKSEIVDTWGAARSGGRRHEGVDIFAESGTKVVATTTLRISRIGYGARGGNYVFAMASGRERYYYAHLDQVDPNLAEGQIIYSGTIIGTVGNTGNAIDTPPHLHFGIYTLGGAINPYPRLVD